MSTDVNVYVLYGVLLDYEEVNAALGNEDGDEAYERLHPYMSSGKNLNPRGSVGVVYDGRSGEYVAIGHVVARSEEWSPLESNISLDRYAPSTEGWGNSVATVLSELGLDPNTPCGWHIISHWH